MNTRVSILMVCLGNICRSPTAHAVLQKKLQEAGLAGKVYVDSAGTADYHTGKSPDERSRMKAATRGYDLSPLRARQVQVHDFAHFDLVLAMDHSNLANLLRICPAEYRDRVQLFLDHSDAPESEVPDPYFGGEQGFDHVLDLIEQACEGLIEAIRPRLERVG